MTKWLDQEFVCSRSISNVLLLTIHLRLVDACEELHKELTHSIHVLVSIAMAMRELHHKSLTNWPYIFWGSSLDLCNLVAALKFLRLETCSLNET